jgi:pimeloyl-ACP methyl ester carboxylesterase
LSYRVKLPRTATGGFHPLTAADDAVTCCRLLDHVGWPAAHVVGHSYGALVALQLALDAPARVATLSLLEPAVRDVPSSAAIVAALQPVIADYRAGDTAGAVDGFLRHVCGDDYRPALEQVVPDALAEALAEADLFFQAEIAAVQQFTFEPGDSPRIRQPVLNVIGANTAPRFVEGGEVVQTWFPNAQRLTIPAAGHLLMIQNPVAVADGLKAHFSRHPLTTWDSTPA